MNYWRKIDSRVLILTINDFNPMLAYSIPFKGKENKVVGYRSISIWYIQSNSNHIRFGSFKLISYHWHVPPKTRNCCHTTFLNWYINTKQNFASAFSNAIGRKSSIVERFKGTVLGIKSFEARHHQIRTVEHLMEDWKFLSKYNLILRKFL